MRTTHRAKRGKRKEELKRRKRVSGKEKTGGEAEISRSLKTSLPIGKREEEVAVEEK